MYIQFNFKPHQKLSIGRSIFTFKRLHDSKIILSIPHSNESLPNTCNNIY